MTIRRISRLLLILVIAAGMIGTTPASVNAASKKPAKVTGVKVTKATESAISLKWSKAKGAKKYEVQYKLSSSKKWRSKKTTKKKIKLSGLKSNKTYNIRVRGLNGSKKGPFSKVKNQKTYIKPDPVNADSIYASLRNRREITLKWKAAAHASWYEVSTQELNSDSYPDIQTPHETQFTTVITMRPNTWYEFRIRSVNSRTGKFPALKSAWTKPFYACSLKGSRVITGTEKNGSIVYELNDTFVIGEDDALTPYKIYERQDPSDAEYYETDVMICSSVAFPADFTEIRKDDTYISSDDVLNGRTYSIGDDFDGDGSVDSITVAPGIEGDLEVTIMAGGVTHEFRW